MGRGRAKAKQTKVARELKYSSGSLDPDRLKAELAAAPPSTSSAVVEDDDPYADADDDDEDDPRR